MNDTPYYTLRSELYPKILEALCDILGREAEVSECTSRFQTLFNLNSEKKYPLISYVFNKCIDGFWNLSSELKEYFKGKLKENWRILIDVDIFGEDEPNIQPTENIKKPTLKMMSISSLMFQKIINATQQFLSKYRYHLSILNACAKLIDVFDQLFDKITIGERWGGVIKTKPSYDLYYDTEMVDLSHISDAEFFDNLYRLQLYFQEVKQYEDLPYYFSREKGTGEFEKTICHLINKMPTNCCKEERMKAKKTLSQFLGCFTKLNDPHTESFDLLFTQLIKGGFAEIYSFRKLVETDLNVIPNLKIKEYEMDALIPITADTVIRCECTLSEKQLLDDRKMASIEEVKNILKEMGLECKTLVVGRECLRSSIPSNVVNLRVISFSELNDKLQVISRILSLI